MVVPEAEHHRRKLAAILSADAAGYARLMADDEAATVETLDKYRRVFADHVQRHDGRVVDSPGDNLLAEFASPVEAVGCALEVQKELARRNRQLADDRRMAFRIGINLGDVIEKADGTVYGDGVNVAARLEALAEPGGVSISEAVHMQVKAKLDRAFDFAGAHEVKNIAEPVRVWRVLQDGEAASAGQVDTDEARIWSPQRIAIAAAVVVVAAGVGVWQLWDRPSATETAGAPSGAPEDAVLALPKGPSIAVLPFTNMSGDAEQDYFADGITEQIISDLARFRELFVIARNSTFQYKGEAVDVRDVADDLGVRYVLEGSVRKSADKIRVTTQLLDGATGSHLWAETYDRDPTAEDIFAIQDAITERVVATLAGSSGVLTRAEVWQAQESITDSLEAYDCVLLAHKFIYVFTPETHLVARDCLERAIQIDPDYVDAWAWRSLVHNYGHAVDFNPRPDDLERALEAARMALKLDPTNQMARTAMAVTYYFRHEMDEFTEEAETAIALNPNNVDVIAELAEKMAYSGQWDRGLALIRKAMALNPMHPSWYWYVPTKYHLVKGNIDQAVDAAQKINQPDYYMNYVVLAYVYALAGRQDDAERAVAAMLELRPDLSVAKVAELYGFWGFRPAYIERFVVTGLRKAGLPEAGPTN